MYLVFEYNPNERPEFDFPNLDRHSAPFFDPGQCYAFSEPQMPWLRKLCPNVTDNQTPAQIGPRMKLDPETLSTARQILIPESGADLIRFMANKSLHRPDSESPPEVIEQAINLGWITPKNAQFTDAGLLIGDSCREYLFWKERDQNLPFEDALPFLTRANFEGKYIIEIGAGMGANLMSLNGTAGRLCGVDPIEAYVQLGSLFREREGIKEVQIMLGGAENLPLPDDEADLTLCVSAHQYFDIHKALPELARITRPGGEVIILGATLGQYAKNSGRAVLRNRGAGLKEYAITMINTLSYQLMGQRILKPRSGFSTSRPIYPSKGFMTRQLAAVGLEPIAPAQHAAGECCFYLRRVSM